MPTDPQALALSQVFSYLLPEMILVAAACVVFLGGTKRLGRDLWGWVSMAALILAWVAARSLAAPRSGPADALSSPEGLFGVPVVFDSLGHLSRLIAYAGCMVLLLLSWYEVPARQASDHHACLLIIAAGTGLVGCANDLITLFLALEMISIPTYIMLYLPKHDAASQEAALKYFLLSIFSSALTLFGFSYLYGLTGSTNLAAIQATLSAQGPGDMPAVAQIALIMIVAGLGFRIAAVPFHFYAPDVYQGAPTIGAALLAFIPKVAGFVALLRVLGYVLPAGMEQPQGALIGMSLSEQGPILLWFLAAVTMTLGNLLALLQDNVKRMLAYSSVAHAGYMLMALAAAPYLRNSALSQGGPDGVEAILYYLVAYGAMTIGAFGVLALLSTPERPVETYDDVAGLSRNRPGLALLLALFLFSLIGIPLTAGFTGKFMIFFGTMSVAGEQAGLFRLLALIAALNAAVGGWYYLRVVAAMYLRNPLKPIETKATGPGLATLAVCAILTVGLSVPPLAGWMLGAAKEAAGIKLPAPKERGLAERK